MAPTYALETAKPYAFRFDPKRTALVIIDVQKDFVDPAGFGSIQCGSAEIFATVRSVVSRIKTALGASRSLGLHVVHTREGHVPDLSDLPASKRYRQVNSPSGHHTLGIGDQGPMGRLLVRGEEGHDIVNELAPLPGECVIDKPGKGSFWATDLHRKLMARGITHLLFAGVTTECCVTTTLREANDRGFECCILSDCTSGFNVSFVQTSMDMVCSYDGLFGYIGSSTELLSLPSSVSRTPPTATSKLPGDLGLESLRNQYSKGSNEPVRLVNMVYDRIEETSATHPNVWIHLRPREIVIEEALRLKQAFAARPLPPLYGIPFAVKDNFDVANLPTTAACPAYSYTPSQSAPSVTAILEAGGLLIGKTNMDQLATGLSGCRSPFGSTTSVYGNSKFISGGSSSGSAVCVASGMVTFALGTDTAGSGRVPAALNGIVGYKPTKGTISARGVVPACRSLDTVSVFATCVADARSVWQVLDVYDPEDAYAKLPGTLPLSAMDYRGVENAGFTFTVPPPSALEACTPEFQTQFWRSVQKLEASGGRFLSISDADFEPFRIANSLLYSGTLVNERIACIGADFLTKNLDHLHPTISKLFGAVLAREAKPYEVFSDQMTQAECTRRAQMLLERIDVMVLPAVPCHPTIEAMDRDPISLNAKMGENTHFANVLDLCTVNVNAAFYQGDEGTMPFGISLVSGMGRDGRLMDVASFVERCFGTGEDV
ncbi:uncharacterized protein LTR77_005272 [Saxophila tyrrhenica]|uniref:Allophanate hydrolase n=1 Tax=Saxophila tyrrhenica TaxID=1690608 RepID=A0AAV9PBJ5_9PEZI|nr:hypothetical protein LTR77_005272 [Saxophila tyrrhenica]